MVDLNFRSSDPAMKRLDAKLFDEELKDGTQSLEFYSSLVAAAAEETANAMAKPGAKKGGKKGGGHASSTSQTMDNQVALNVAQEGMLAGEGQGDPTGDSGVAGQIEQARQGGGITAGEPQEILPVD